MRGSGQPAGAESSGPRSWRQRVSGRLWCLPDVGTGPVEQVDRFLEHLGDRDLVEERGPVGAAVPGTVREAGGATVRRRWARTPGRLPAGRDAGSGCFHPVSTTPTASRERVRTCPWSVTYVRHSMVTEQQEPEP